MAKLTWTPELLRVAAKLLSWSKLEAGPNGEWRFKSTPHGHWYTMRPASMRWEDVTEAVDGWCGNDDDRRIAYYRKLGLYKFARVEHSDGRPSAYLPIGVLNRIHDATTEQRLYALCQAAEEEG